MSELRHVKGEPELVLGGWQSLLTIVGVWL